MAGIEGLLPIQQSFNGGEIGPLAQSRTDQARYQTGCKVMHNCYPLVQGPVTRRPGTYFLGRAKYSDKTTRIIPFAFSSAQARILEIGDRYIRFWTDKGYILNSDGIAPYEIVTPFTADQITDLNFAQSADVIYIASPHHAPMKLSRYGDTDWRLSTILFRPAINTPPAPSLAVKGSVPASGKVVNYYQVTVVDKATGEESLPSPTASIESDSLTTTYYVEITAVTQTNAAEYRFYKRRAGVFGFIGRSEGPVFEDKNFGADTSDTPPREKNPFTEPDSYPAAVFLWQQRLGWASTKKNPITIWMSRSGTYENLSASQPPKDDDGIEMTLAAKGQDKILWLDGDQILFMGTSGAEWKITGLNDDPLITPKSFTFSKQGTYGSAVGIQPLSIGGNMLFVQRGIGDVREMGYNFQRDRFLAPSAMLLANHLLIGRKIVDWAWQGTTSILWATMDDGKLIACTYLPEHEVIGWHQHSTDGEFIDSASIPGTVHDKLFFLTKRTVDGEVVQYIEVLADPFMGPNVADAYFVDCGLTYRGEPVTELTGLHHLEGCKVAIFADGATMPNEVVTDGVVKMTQPSSVVHVGLPFTSEVIPNRPEVATQQGSIQARNINIVKASVKFYLSMNVQVGSESSPVKDVLLRSAEDLANPSLITAEVDPVTLFGWNKTDSLRFLVTDPVPMTILRVTYGIRIAPMI